MELKELYMEKGLTEQEAATVVARVSSNDDRFLEDMLVNELHIHGANLESPYKLGGVIGLSFLVGAARPPPPILLDRGEGTRSRWRRCSSRSSSSSALAPGRATSSGRPLWKSGLETLLIGALAAGILCSR